MSKKPSKVFLVAWTGDSAKGLKFVEGRYCGAEVVELSRRELRESGWKGQIRTFTRLRGKALVFYFRTMEDVRAPESLTWIHLLHGCSETVLADEAGNMIVITLKECARDIFKVTVRVIKELAVFGVSWLRFRGLLKKVSAAVRPPIVEGSPDIAYIYPYPLNRQFSGGAISHFRGFLQGAAENEVTCEVISGCKLPFTLPFPIKQVPPPRHSYVFYESLTISYNWQFAREARKLLAGKKPRVIYQRHGRFVIAGVLLARALGVPLVLEYNGSEVWFAAHWDPARFDSWLRMAEEIALWGASTIVVVAEPLKAELITRGLPAERILVNPNGVDPSKFRPECAGRDKIRSSFGFEPQHVVVSFLGTFSYFHGVEVLQEAIRKLLRACPSDQVADKLRFLLVGDGLLLDDMRVALKEFEKQGRVAYAGIVPHDDAPGYLDAADVLVSPHVPMPDGRPFIGSPTKLFEYLAMGKAIVASRLDQLAMVLTHNETALLVRPGDVDDLASAISVAASDPDLRARLGRNARAAAIANHTWKKNAAETLLAAGLRPAPVSIPICE